MKETKESLLKRIDVALSRMKEDPYKANLRAKRDAIANGASYVVRDLTKETIHSFGKLFGKNAQPAIMKKHTKKEYER